MTVLKHKTFDAMEAPKWSGQRSKPPVETTLQLQDAPPIPPDFHCRTVSVLPYECNRRVGPTLALPNHPSSPVPQPIHFNEKKSQPPIESFSQSDEAWFKTDPVQLLEPIVMEAAIRTSPFTYVVGAVIGIGCLAISWFTLTTILFRDL